MHISEVEKYRMGKDHEMRHGYQTQTNSKFPHEVGIGETQPIFKEIDNKHAMEIQPEGYFIGGYK